MMRTNNLKKVFTPDEVETTALNNINLEIELENLIYFVNASNGDT